MGDYQVAVYTDHKSHLQSVYNADPTDLADYQLDVAGADLTWAQSVRLEDAGMPDDVLARLTPRLMMSVTRLKLVAVDGSEAIVEFEPARPFHGFRKVVLMRIAQARSASPDA